MRQETRDLLSFLRRPSSIVVVITFCVQVMFRGDLSRFGYSLFSQWDHLDWNHWLGNIVPVYFFTFLLENKIGKFKTWIFLLLSLAFCQISFVLPWAPPLNELTQVVGLSGLVCGLCGYWCFVPSQKWACISARVLTLLLFIVSIQADPYTRWGHAAGWIFGFTFWAFQSLSYRSLSFGLKKSH